MFLKQIVTKLKNIGIRYGNTSSAVNYSIMLLKYEYSNACVLQRSCVKSNNVMHIHGHTVMFCNVSVLTLINIQILVSVWPLRIEHVTRGVVPGYP